VDATALGEHLTLYGAIRRSGWVVLNSAFASANEDRFVAWLSSCLLSKLRKGDVLVMNNLKALTILGCVARLV